MDDSSRATTLTTTRHKKRRRSSRRASNVPSQSRIGGSRSNLAQSRSRGSVTNVAGQRSKSALGASQSRNRLGSQHGKVGGSRMSQAGLVGGSRMSQAGLMGAPSKVTVVQQESRWSLTPRGKFAKILLFGFNILFLLTGVSILALGVWIKLDKSARSFQIGLHGDKPSESYIEQASYTMIAIGVFVILVAFFGCCGACSENNCLLTVYVFCLVMIYGGEIAIGVIAGVFKNQALSQVKAQKAKDFNSGHYIPGNQFAQAWDRIQQDLQCCGVYNYRDYANITWTGNDQQFVPGSCCVFNDTKKAKDPVRCQKEAKGDTINFEFLYSKGCFDTLIGHVNKNLGVILGVIVTVVFIELMGIILACCVCFSRRRKPATEVITRELF